MKETSVFLICLLFLTVIYGLSATLPLCSEESKDLQYDDKTLVDDKIPHSRNATLVDDKIPHSRNATLV